MRRGIRTLITLVAVAGIVAASGYTPRMAQATTLPHATVDVFSGDQRLATAASQDERDPSDLNKRPGDVKGCSEAVCMAGALIYRSSQMAPLSPGQYSAVRLDRTAVPVFASSIDRPPRVA